MEVDNGQNIPSKSMEAMNAQNVSNEIIEDHSDKNDNDVTESPCCWKSPYLNALSILQSFWSETIVTLTS